MASGENFSVTNYPYTHLTCLSDSVGDADLERKGGSRLARMGSSARTPFRTIK